MAEEYRFIHVGFTWKNPPKAEELEPVFNKARDWMRYAPNCWILYTKIDPDAWYVRIKPHLGDGDHVLIAEINLSAVNTSYTGYESKWIWDWIRKQR
jgi:hypothetical protein